MHFADVPGILGFSGEMVFRLPHDRPFQDPVTGVTRSIVIRTRQHKEREHEGFTSRYRIDRVVYVECFTDIDLAIAREKEIKKMRRIEKIHLIVSRTPTWKGLSEDWDDAMTNYAINKGR